jgi:uncharacterized protein
MYADEKDLRSLWAITLAAFLLLSLKLGALVQYMQQTHHVLLEINPNLAAADIFDLNDEIETTRQTWDEIQGQAENRMIKAGQIIIAGDAALPVPPAPACPAIENACDAKNPLVESTPTVTPTVTTPTATTSTTVQNRPTPSPMADPEKSTLAEKDVPIELQAGDKVLLVGDSMMQGLGPHIVSSLSRNNAVQTVDLSRHSTGLAYPHYFDWPNTILQKLQSEKFALMMIFIGANDTWDIVIDGKYTSFGNPKWIEVYSERVEKIILTAKAYNVRVLWLGAPPMGREKMVDRIPSLNSIFIKAAEKYPGVARYVDTGPTLTSDGKTFSKFIELPERGKVMVRTDDGVHFTVNGQRLLAQLALSQLVLHKVDPKIIAAQRSLAASSASASVASSSLASVVSSAAHENSSAQISSAVSSQSSSVVSSASEQSSSVSASVDSQESAE